MIEETLPRLWTEWDSSERELLWRKTLFCVEAEDDHLEPADILRLEEHGLPPWRGV